MICRHFVLRVLRVASPVIETWLSACHPAMNRFVLKTLPVPSFLSLTDSPEPSATIIIKIMVLESSLVSMTKSTAERKSWKVTECGIIRHYVHDPQTMLHAQCRDTQGNIKWSVMYMSCMHWSSSLTS